jgi:hypothetical protein
MNKTQSEQKQRKGCLHIKKVLKSKKLKPMDLSLDSNKFYKRNPDWIFIYWQH